MGRLFDSIFLSILITAGLYILGVYALTIVLFLLMIGAINNALED